MEGIFFGVSTGRVASMTLANLINLEENVLCLHEGKVRDLEHSGEEVLAFLTLQNRLAYEYPDRTDDFICSYRNFFPEICHKRGLTHFGDIAYNYAPMIGALHRRYPFAKFIYQYRDCLSFVESCTNVAGLDTEPVGWPPDGKELSAVEKYIGLGRLQPVMGTKEAIAWESWSYISKNIWLWAETNRLIYDELCNIDESLYLRVNFHSFAGSSVAEYERIRKFLDFGKPLPVSAKSLLSSRPINARKEKIIIREKSLTLEESAVYYKYAMPIRYSLGLG